jgi:hypothetical protein
MKRLVIILALALVGGMVTAIPAEAANCPPPTVGGKSIGTVKVGKRSVPLKPVTYKKNGPLWPPATNQAAGLSIRNKKLTAKKGKSVITWHVRYGKGCNGTLNNVLKAPIGSVFSVKMKGSKPLYFEVTKKDSVKKTRLKRSWFARTGAHRLVLLTCDDLVGNVFRRTQAVIAKRVPKPVPTPSPTAPPAGAEAASPTPGEAPTPAPSPEAP